MKNTIAYIGLGSNLGDRRRNIERSLQRLRRLPDVELLRVSPLYETEPVGGPPQESFLNGVVSVRTKLSPLPLLRSLLAIERRIGRQRRGRWGPRVIDLDLLSIDKICRKTKGLTLPHPRYHERRFVLLPFTKLAPRYIHPRLGLSNATLLRRLTPHGQRATIHSLWRKTQYYRYKRRKKTVSLSPL